MSTSSVLRLIQSSQLLCLPLFVLYVGNKKIDILIIILAKNFVVPILVISQFLSLCRLLLHSYLLFHPVSPLVLFSLQFVAILVYSRRTYILLYFSLSNQHVTHTHLIICFKFNLCRILCCHYLAYYSVWLINLIFSRRYYWHTQFILINSWLLAIF